MKKNMNFFLSTKMMAILFITFILSMAIGTFLENDYGSISAKNIIYGSWWFELNIILLVIIFIYNIKKYHLFNKDKLPVLIFHLSFIIICIGSAITRYISFEGVMHIREGEKSNRIITNKCYLKFQIINSDNSIVYNDVDYQLSFLSKKLKKKYQYKDKIIQLKIIDFIPRVKDSIKEESSGRKIIKLVTSNKNNQEIHFLYENTYSYIGKTLIGYNILNKEFKGINLIQNKSGNLFIQSNQDLDYIMMLNEKKNGKIKYNAISKLKLKTIYYSNSINFFIPHLPKNGKLIHYSDNKKNDIYKSDLIVLEVKINNHNHIVSFKGGRGYTGIQLIKTIDGITMGIGYSAKIIFTPFQIKLKKFNLQRYPGSLSPFSYMSSVVIFDKNIALDKNISMNNVLDYKGFRFFQSSFDPDEKGTILSVNHDFWGTYITYIGYISLFIGIFFSLFWKGTRFIYLINKLKSINRNNKKYIYFLLFFILFSFSQYGNVNKNINNLNIEKNINSELNFKDINELKLDHEFNDQHILAFEKILVQDIEGRIIPLHTLALQLVRKLSKKDNIFGMHPCNWLLSLLIDPITWFQVPIIKISKKLNHNLLKKININKDNYTSLAELFYPNQFGIPQFIFEKEFQKAFRKSSINQNENDKAIIDINEKIIILQNIISHQYLRFFPIKHDLNNLWTTWYNENLQIYPEKKNMIYSYLESVIQANATKKWHRCNKKLEEISNYQNKWGKNIIPSQIRIKTEIFYNKINIFVKLLFFYSILSVLLLSISLLDIIINRNKLNKNLKYLTKILIFLLLIGSIFHFLGLILRWYISDHAPWSNGYEAIMFISWIAILGGFVLYKNSNPFIPISGCFVAVIMMIFAHVGVELNPQITPLVPVLQSYWLIIHVAIITASYAFFGISMMIGIIVLLLFIISCNLLHTKKIIKELTIINELSLMIGLYLLTIGTFLGGIWANESWGRYWSWDPKETWALISIITYSFVLHSRLIPKLKGLFIFNFMSIISFSSIIMTYFGVNYYLSGLHSYAAGDPIPIPMWIYCSLFFILILTIISFISYKKNIYIYNE